jgi:uncharacterized repeat protein (TIGR01451 family)
MSLLTRFSRLGQSLAFWLSPVCALLFLLAGPRAEAAYVQVYSTIQKGAVTFTGNTLTLNSLTISGQGGAFIAANLNTQLTTPNYAGVLPAAPPGTTLAWASNASKASLAVPIGATVLYAELIWSGTIGSLATAVYDTQAVSFTTPSGSTYSIVPSGATKGSSGTYYTRSANVTGLVQLGGSGTYTVGGVPAQIATSGSTDAAGWTLAVAYADPSQVARNLTIFVGAEQVGAAPATVSGFCTPVTGTVNGRLAVSAIEGDATGTGDYMLFGPTSTLGLADRVYGPNNPANGFLGRTVDNFFASQINGDNGTLDTSGTFGTRNQIIVASGSGTNVSAARQGYDITNVDVSARLLNSQTTAAAQGNSASDNFAINALGLQINVTTPVFPVSNAKKVNKTTTFVGDQLTYTIDLDNRAGNGAANNVVFFDNVPPGTSFVPGSITVDLTPVTAPNPVSVGGDPATGITIGNMAVGSVVRVSFKVNVVALPASPAPAQFVNAARWDYTYVACAGVLLQKGSVNTSPVTTTSARLEPTKTVSPTGPLVGGQTAIYTISIPNTGLLNTAGTTLADPIPAGTTYIAGSTKLNGVSVADGAGGSMPFATAALVKSTGQAPGVIAVGAVATVQFSVAATSGATVNNVATIDPDGAGPGTALTVSAVNSGLNGPSVAKTFAPSTIGAGSKSRLTVTLTNPNATAITAASVTDNLPNGMVIANPANATTTCLLGAASATPPGTTLALSGATIPASGSCTFSADVTVAVAGTYTNTILVGAVSSSNAGISTAGSQSLTVTPPPSVSKAFTPSTVAPNISSALSITLTNPTATLMTGVSFTDIFPNTGAGASGNMTLFSTSTTNTCSGSLSTSTGAVLAVGSDSVKLTGGSIPANNVCTITVNVKAPAGGTYANTIPVGALSTSSGSNTVEASASLQIASPQVTKSFAATTVAANAATAMTITLTNVTDATITGIGFADTYPTGLVNSATTVTNTGCGGAPVASATATNPGTLTFTGGSLAAGASCTLSVNVQSATSGSYTNTIAAGAVASSIGTNATGNSATLNVARPSISKAFSVATVPLNNTATLTITLSNPTGTNMTGAAFTDTLPAGLTASVSGGTCAGAKTASGSIVSIAGGTIPLNASCTVTATVTATSVGLKINTILAGGLTVTGPVAASNGTAATADITVLAAPTITKSFLTSPILPNTDVTTLQIVLANSNPTALTGATFTDTFPTSPGVMTIADLTTTNSCSGSLFNNLGAALAVGSAGIQLTGGTIPANGSCTITVNVKASLAGDYTNTIPASPTAGFLNTANGGGNTVVATAPLSVRLAAPTVAKSFSPATIVANTSTTLTLTITNPSTTQAITGVAWSDIFPAGMKVFSTPGFTNTCGGTVTAGSAANDTSINISGATVPFNAGGTGSCSISVAVTSTVVAASPGMANTTGTVTSTNANTSATAAASLIVTAPPLTSPTIAKAFLQPTIGSGDISTIRFTLGNANVTIVNSANFTDTLTNMSVASTSLGGTCTGVTNSPALVVGANGTNALNLTVPNLPPGGCTVEVQVTSTNLGNNLNSVSGVTTTQTPTAGAGAGPVNLTVFTKPTIAKAFSPTSITSGGTSAITFTLGNPNAGALTNANFTDPLINMALATTAIGGTCVGVTNSPALSVGATTLNLTIPSLPAGGCTVTVQVTSANSGLNPNTASGVATTETPTVGVASNTANLTVISGVPVSGTVYSDANHSTILDGGEVGTGQTLFVKLAAASGGVCGAPAIDVATVNPGSGNFSFALVVAGDYCLVLDNNNTLSDITATPATGWLFTETPNGVRQLTVASQPLPNQNFGLYNGSKLSGAVFADTGVSGGTANDSIQNGGEVGIGGVSVKATNGGASTTYDSAATDGAGNYTLWLPATAVGTVLISETNLTGYLSTGGSVGSTAGSYARNSDNTSFALTAGNVYTNVNFADVMVNQFGANGMQSGSPGGVVFYPHQFIADSGGSVALSAVSASGWPIILYRDTNCNGQIDSGDPVMTGAITVVAGEKVCIVNKVSMPAGVSVGAQDVTTVQAAFTYTNANPALSATLTLTDVTQVSSSAGLVLSKSTDKTTAQPSEILTYTIVYQNNGSTPLNAIVINDATPAFTTFISATCIAPLPAAIGACSVNIAPAIGGVGAVQWVFTGSLAPAAAGQVEFRVKVNN